MVSSSSGAKVTPRSVPFSAMPPKKNKEEYLPETEARLTCANKRLLLRSLRQAQSRPIADWLFSSSQRLFHLSPTLSHHAFDTSVYIRTTQNMCSRHDNSKAVTDLDKCGRGGSEVLFVPLGVGAGRILGYTFGGDGAVREGCPYGDVRNGMFPHHIGRFCYDIASNDLLMVIPNVVQGLTGIIHIRVHQGYRERSLFAVKNGTYGYQRLPSAIGTLCTGVERMLECAPKFLFEAEQGFKAQGKMSSELSVLQKGMAKLERGLKGDFFAEKMRRDDIDLNDGEIVSRRTSTLECRFDARDALREQTMREMAGTLYYSYMSRSSGSGSSGSS